MSSFHSPHPSEPAKVPPPVHKRQGNNGKQPRCDHTTAGKRHLDFDNLCESDGKDCEKPTSLQVKRPKTTRGSDEIGLQEENEDSREVKMAAEEQVARMGAELDKIEKFLFEQDPLTGKLPSREDWRRTNRHVEKFHRIAVGRCHP
jgi:hypothetical protein